MKFTSMEDKMKHTKGPYRIYEDANPELPIFITGWSDEAETSFDIATVETAPTSDEQRANARLIAAAPQMYDLLKEMANVPQSKETDEQRRANDLLHYIDGYGLNPKYNLLIGALDQQRDLNNSGF